MLRGTKWVALRARDPLKQCQEILETTRQDFSEIRVGQTMLLYRAEQYRLLELLRALALERVCGIIQARARGMIARLERYLRENSILVVLPPPFVREFLYKGGVRLTSTPHTLFRELPRELDFSLTRSNRVDP